MIGLEHLEAAAERLQNLNNAASHPFDPAGNEAVAQLLSEEAGLEHDALAAFSVEDARSAIRSNVHEGLPVEIAIAAAFQRGAQIGAMARHVAEREGVL